MAKLKLKLNENVDGNYFGDSTCIDCDTCRRFAPLAFGDGDELAFVKSQPRTREANPQISLMMLLCV